MADRPAAALTAHRLTAGDWARDPHGRLVRLGAYIPSIDCWFGEFLYNRSDRCARAWLPEHLTPTEPTEEELLAWLLTTLAN